MKKDVNNLLKLSKRIVSKNIYENLKKITDEEELKNAVQYSVNSALMSEYYTLKTEIEKLEEKKIDVFFAKNKIFLIPSKIKHFQVDFDEDEFNKLAESFGYIRSEIGKCLTR